MIGLNKLPFLHKIIRILITFSLVCFAWIFFRAADFDSAVYIVKNIFTGIGNITYIFSPERLHILYLDKTMFDFSVAIILIIALKSVQMIQRQGNVIDRLNQKPLVIRWLAYYILLIIILLFGQFDIAQQFIYFQF